MKKSVPLSPANIERLMKQTKALQKELNSKNFRKNVEDIVGLQAKNAVDTEVFSLGAEVDGNAIGQVTYKQLASSTRVTWQGEQISFIEFGTGAAGFVGSYPNWAFMQSLGYTPDPTKESWSYVRDGVKVTSFGIPAMAPMWKAAVKVRRDLPNKDVKLYVERTVNNAFNS